MPSLDGARRDGTRKPRPFSVSLPKIAGDPTSKRTLTSLPAKELWELGEQYSEVKVGEPFPSPLKSWLRSLWNDRGMKVVVAGGEEATIPERYRRQSFHTICLEVALIMSACKQPAVVRALLAWGSGQGVSHMLNGTRSAHSFFEHLDRLFKPTYRPTDQDILRCRQKTTGISETAFHHRGMHYRSVSLSSEVRIRQTGYRAHVLRGQQNIRRWRATERAAEVVSGGREISRSCVADEEPRTQGTLLRERHGTRVPGVSLRIRCASHSGLLEAHADLLIPNPSSSTPLFPSAPQQNLHEDRNSNQMQEALMLFDSICNSRWFAQTAMILFLNKQDVFTARVPVSSITSHFPDYEGTRVPSILLLRTASEPDGGAYR